MQHALKTVFAALVFLLVLETTFAIHEYGHLREFQKNKVPVKEFSLGIGYPLYQHHGAEFTFSIRAIPIAAYVMPTEGGNESIYGKLPIKNKIIVSAAGIRNNFAVSLMLLFFFQVLGWKKGYLSPKELIKTMLYTPIKIILLFFAFMPGCLTLGIVDLKEKFLLSTGKITPPKIIMGFLFWNLVLGLVNVAPILPMDGGRIAQDLLPISIAHSMAKIATPLLIFFMISANLQKFRILEADIK